MFGSVFLSSIFQPVFSQSSVQDTGSGTNLGILSRKEFNIGLRLMNQKDFCFRVSIAVIERFPLLLLLLPL